MTISQKSLKKEIFSAYLDAQKEIEILKKEIQLLESKKNSELISKENYVQDFSNRMKIHNDEINFLKNDLVWLANYIQKQSRKVELPAFLK
tara:strand:+ start:559 stop:831 length:273 start_codon:yes stop_codon:yes gene_type:complete